MFVCPADLETEADRIFDSHAQFMQRTHYRDGDKALLQYTVTKGPREDGAVIYAITEVYQSPAGPEDHLARSHDWEDISAWRALMDKSEGPWVINGIVQHSLW